MGIYLYSGKDTYRIENALDEVLNQHKIDKKHRIYFDGSDKKFSLSNALIECDSLSLFAEDNHKAVIIKDPFFLKSNSKDTKSSSKKKIKNNDQDKRIELLNSYFDNPCKDTELVFLCSTFDADSRKKEYKLISKNATVVSFDLMKEYEFEDYMNKELNKNNIILNKEARKELSLRVNNSTLILHKAIEKILLYGKNNLDLNDIKHLVSLNPDVNVYRMADAFIKGNLSLAIRAKDEMLNSGYTYQSLIPKLSSKIRSSYNMKFLYEQGLSEQEISTRLRANIYAVKFSLQAIGSTSSKTLLKYLNDLAEIDQGIKSGLLDPKNSLEDFLIRNGVKHAKY